MHCHNDKQPAQVLFLFLFVCSFIEATDVLRDKPAHVLFLFPFVKSAEVIKQLQGSTCSQCTRCAPARTSSLGTLTELIMWMVSHAPPSGDAGDQELARR